MSKQVMNITDKLKVNHHYLCEIINRAEQVKEEKRKAKARRTQPNRDAPE